MNNNKTTNILLGILIVVLIAIGIIMARNQNRNSYRNDIVQNDDSMMDNQSNTPELVKTISNQQVQTTTDNTKPLTTTHTQTNSSTSSDVKTYTNSEYGFSFQYPVSWDQDGDPAKVIDLQGNVTNLEINFKDTKSNSNLLVAYYLPPKGNQGYQYALSNYDASQGNYQTGKKKVSVAGVTALEADTTLTQDGRGNTISPMRSINVIFLDKSQTGSFRLVFSTDAPGDPEIVKFNQLLSSFKMM